MFSAISVEASSHERRRILAIIDNPSLRTLVSTFLVTMGCACNVVSSGEAGAGIEREIYDAVLLDSDLSAADIENAILKIRESRPSLLSRILVVCGALVTPQVLELVERNNLHQVAQESLLQQLWGTLQDLFERSHCFKVAPQSMHIARVIFDSSHAPFPINLRSTRSNYRRVAYQHGGATVDLLIKPRDDSGRISITGQVLGGRLRKGENNGLPVLLISAMRTTARTNTNENGEFHLECQPERELIVQMRLREGVWLSLPLRELDGLNLAAVRLNGP